MYRAALGSTAGITLISPPTVRVAARAGAERLNGMPPSCAAEPASPPSPSASRSPPHPPRPRTPPPAPRPAPAAPWPHRCGLSPRPTGASTPASWSAARSSTSPREGARRRSALESRLRPDGGRQVRLADPDSQAPRRRRVRLVRTSPRPAASRAGTSAPDQGPAAPRAGLPREVRERRGRSVLTVRRQPEARPGPGHRGRPQRPEQPHGRRHVPHAHRSPAGRTARRTTTSPGRPRPTRAPPAEAARVRPRRPPAAGAPVVRPPYAGPPGGAGAPPGGPVGDGHGPGGPAVLTGTSA